MLSAMDLSLEPYILPEIYETGKVLGSGAYGKVTELKLPNGTVVAGKKIHNSLFDPDTEPGGMRSLKEGFEQECVR